MSTTAVIVGRHRGRRRGRASSSSLRNRSTHNSVDSFRRQIDALGPAARRTVVDQVQQTLPTATLTRRADDEPTRADPADPADEGGARGT